MSRAGVLKQSNLASSWSFEDGGVGAPSQISPATAQSESAAAGVVRVHEGICFGDDRPTAARYLLPAGNSKTFVTSAVQDQALLLHFIVPEAITCPVLHSMISFLPLPPLCTLVGPRTVQRSNRAKQFHLFGHSLHHVLYIETVVLLRPAACIAQACWTPAQLREEEFVINLTPQHIAELDSALQAVAGCRIQTVTQADVVLPTLSAVLQDSRHQLEHGRGFALLKGLPVSRWGEDNSRRAVRPESRPSIQAGSRFRCGQSARTWGGRRSRMGKARSCMTCVDLSKTHCVCLSAARLPILTGSFSLNVSASQSHLRCLSSCSRCA